MSLIVPEFLYHGSAEAFPMITMWSSGRRLMMTRVCC